MPPSPALRYSPGRELRAGNHKRGHSFEGSLLSREKDDDLALFNEMQAREKHNFLLQSSDDIEESFSTKVRNFSDLKLGVTIPVRGESSDLLNADGDKNDYDWLLTPPDTPLFPSLDDEPAAVAVASRGRPLSQPISISRSSTMEKSHRSSRGSPSPSRLSPSPRSTSSVSQTRGRASSAPHYSPTPNVRSSTPSRRPSPPPIKPSTSVPRSSTPTPRRVSAGSGGTVVTSGIRGTSPIKASRGNSASPKIRAWQANIPGFSSDAPPNLRTSLADRPASYVRGSSPASRNSRDSASKFCRQSMSPTASRSICSSHSHERDRLSSYSRGSVPSSGDDEADSLPSIPLDSLDSISSKNVGAFPNNKVAAVSKKPARIISTSAPKRSFDSAIRPMDHRKSPQMFRPLLSSVPSSTFHAGKTGSAHRPFISRNSSVTTSSNGSSDQGTHIAHDTEGSDHNRDNMAAESEKVLYEEIHDEIFVFDKMDVLNEGFDRGFHNKSQEFQHGAVERSPSTQHADSEDSTLHGVLVGRSAASRASLIKFDSSEVASLANVARCSRCGEKYEATDMMAKDVTLCPECKRVEKLINTIIPEEKTTSAGSSQVLLAEIPEADISQINMGLPATVLDLPTVTESGEPKACQSEENSEQSVETNSCLKETVSFKSLAEKGEQKLPGHLDVGQPIHGHNLSDAECERPKSITQNDHQNFKVEEVAGIPILLKRSSSSKGLLFQGRTLSAATIPYDELSYARDSLSSFRSSTGLSSLSASSSADFSATRPVENRVQRQLSGRKADMENHKHEMNMKAQIIGTSISGISSNPYQALGSSAQASFSETSGDQLEYVATDGTSVTSQVLELGTEYAESDVSYTSSARLAIVEVNNGCNNSSEIMNGSTLEDLRHSETSLPNHEDSALCEHKEVILNNRSVSDVDALVVISESPPEKEHSMVDAGVSEEDDGTASTHPSARAAETEIGKASEDTDPGMQNEDAAIISKDVYEKLRESADRCSLDRDLAANVLDVDTNDSGILEESTVLVESKGGNRGRSLTLDEATDTILFCSSIVHDLAYSAATIAMEKKSPVLEGSRPTVTILGKSDPDRKEPRGRTIGRNALKSQKPKQRPIQTNAKTPPSKVENDENADESAIRNVGLPNKVDSMKPPKLESKCNCTIM